MIRISCRSSFLACVQKSIVRICFIESSAGIESILLGSPRHVEIEEEDKLMVIMVIDVLDVVEFFVSPLDNFHSNLFEANVCRVNELRFASRSIKVHFFDPGSLIHVLTIFIIQLTD